MTTRPRQLPLNIRLRDEATFDNFWVGDSLARASAVAALRAMAAGTSPDTFLYLWGPSGSGASHLLQAACQEVTASQYLPLAELVNATPADLLEGLDQVPLLCLDNIEAVAGRGDWDEALFHLYNRVREGGGRLVVTGPCAPRDLPDQCPGLLPDLQSRLAWGAVYRLEVLDDREKSLALQWRARRRGFELGEEVAQYLLSRSSREPRDLFDCLDRLDCLSLAEKRRLTIPFVRAALEG